MKKVLWEKFVRIMPVTIIGLAILYLWGGTSYYSDPEEVIGTFYFVCVLMILYSGELFLIAHKTDNQKVNLLSFPMRIILPVILVNFLLVFLYWFIPSFRRDSSGDVWVILGLVFFSTVSIFAGYLYCFLRVYLFKKFQAEKDLESLEQK